jgi:hypothetical protein
MRISTNIQCCVAHTKLSANIQPLTHKHTLTQLGVRCDFALETVSWTRFNFFNKFNTIFCIFMKMNVEYYNRAEKKKKIQHLYENEML